MIDRHISVVLTYYGSSENMLLLAIAITNIFTFDFVFLQYKYIKREFVPHNYIYGMPVFPSVPGIVILGPPCSGKRSIAKMVCGKLRCAHLTPQNLIEEADIAIRDQARKFIALDEVRMRTCFFFSISLYMLST